MGVLRVRKTLTLVVCVGLVAVCAVGQSASTPFFNDRPVPVTLSPGGDIDDLQEVFDDIYVSGPGIDAYEDQASFGVFTNSSSGGAVTSLIIELAESGNVDSNQFGLYDYENPGNKALVFTGSQSAGNQAMISFLANGDIKVNFQLRATGFSSRFGLYLDVYGTDATLDYTFYSQDTLNGGGAAQALVFQGDDQTVIQIPGFFPGVFSNNEYIIAFEETLLGSGSSGQDYDDMVVMVEQIVPVPEPGTVVLLGLFGVIGLTFLWWKKR